jgi:hypothetical protein
MPRTRHPLPLAVLGILVVSACSSESAPVHRTANMADTLEMLASLAEQNPDANQFLNRRRAARFERMGGGFNERYRAAQEWLVGGETQRAIGLLDTIARDAQLSRARITRGAKPLFDLLASAWLRFGEQENCQWNPSADVCILPLDGGGRHVRERGARTALGYYRDLLRDFPDDRGSRWLYNLAALALGEYPAKVPTAWRIPGLDRRSGAFPMPPFRNVAPNVGLDFEGISGGVSIADFNGDGLLDLFVTAFGIRDAPHLFLADGAGGFRDATNEAGIARITGGLNNVHADVDNDGDEDVFIMRGAWLGDAGAWPNSLLLNDGKGHFTDVTFAAGLGSFHPTHSAAFADVDMDGWLDLFVGNEGGRASGTLPHPSELYLNNRDGTFRNIALPAGLAVDDFVKGATWGDVNDDGRPDLYLSILGGPNRLFLNRAGSGDTPVRFDEVPNAGGASKPLMSFATWFWDYDNDGRDDLFAVSYDNRNSGALHDLAAREFLREPLTITLPDGRIDALEIPRLYRNVGGGRFIDMSDSAGFGRVALFGMGANFGDLDNDGWLDIHVGTGNPDLRSLIPNRMFRNVDGRRFDDVSIDGGFAHLQKGHATAFVDLDGDLDNDVFMVLGGAYEGDRFRSVLYENPGRPGHRAVSLTLQGTTANRSAIGARIALTVREADGRERTLHRTVNTGGSFGAGTLTQLIGVGTATRIVRADITWPDAARTRQTLGALEIGRSYRVVQGANARLMNTPAIPFRTTRAPHAHR